MAPVMENTAYVASLFVLLLITTNQRGVLLLSSHVKTKLETSAPSDVRSSIEIAVTLLIVALLNLIAPLPGSSPIVVDVLKVYLRPALSP